jgi:hypothetical protein
MHGSFEGTSRGGSVLNMSRRLNVSFSLLRLMLCCTLFAGTLGLGIELGSEHDWSLLVSATAASLLAFVAKWRQLPVIIVSALGAILGAGSLALLPAVNPPGPPTLLDYCGAAFGGWGCAAVLMRAFFARDFAYRMTGDANALPEARADTVNDGEDADPTGRPQNK